MPIQDSVPANISISDVLTFPINDAATFTAVGIIERIILGSGGEEVLGIRMLAGGRLFWVDAVKVTRITDIINDLSGVTVTSEGNDYDENVALLA